MTFTSFSLYHSNGGPHRQLGTCPRLGLALLLALAPLFSAGDEEDWAYATAGKQFSFPRDHGSHPEYRIEWWYLTGHLFAGERRFGFESTFFRLAQEPGGKRRGTLFDESQIYMTHMALSDLAEEKFYHEERLNREGWNAYARTEDLDTRNGNWHLRRNPDNSLRLDGSIQSRVRFGLDLVPAKPHVLFGENGISVKGRAEGAASYYITFTRLQASGELRVDGEDFEVTGTAWMDHEISSSQLDEDQVGWDWTSVQFDDGRELMLYMLRLREGGYSEFSQLYWIDENAGLTRQNPGEFEWIAGGEWESPETGAIYPIAPRFVTTDPKTGVRRTFQLLPLMENQEMSGKLGGVPYWEGACDVIDVGANQVVGRAYLELAGYVEGLEEQLR